MNRKDMIECIKDNIIKESGIVPNTVVRETIDGEGRQISIGDGYIWHVYMEYPTKIEYLYNGYIISEENSTVLNPKNTVVGSVVTSGGIFANKFIALMEKSDDTVLNQILSDNKINSNLLVEYMNLRKDILSTAETYADSELLELSNNIATKIDLLQRLEKDLDNNLERCDANNLKYLTYMKEKNNIEKEINNIKSMTRKDILGFIGREEIVNYLEDHDMIDSLAIKSKYTIKGDVKTSEIVNGIKKYYYPATCDVYYDDIALQSSNTIYASSIELKDGYMFEMSLSHYEIRKLLRNINDYDFDFILNDLNVSKHLLCVYIKTEKYTRLEEIIHNINDICLPQARFYEHRIKEVKANINKAWGELMLEYALYLEKKEDLESEEANKKVFQL